MRPRQFNEVIDGLRYNTEAAVLLAGDDHWDGHNYERHGRNTYLYRTPRGRYFVTHLTQWQGERDRLEPVSREAAIEIFEGMSEREAPYEDAFPGIKIEEA